MRFKQRHFLSHHKPCTLLASCLLVAVCALPLAVADTEQTADLDGDGVPDHRDHDQDNDAILNTDEGLIAITAADLSPAADLQYRQDSLQADGNTAQYLFDADGAQISLHGSSAASASDVRWLEHASLLKVQSAGPGVATVLWSARKNDRPVAMNLDITVSDLDVERREALLIDAGMLVGYSVADDALLNVQSTDDGLIRFMASGKRGSASVSVVLHVRNRNNLVIGYANESAADPAVGSRAGFRHSFAAGVEQFYTPVVHAIDSDGDGLPDHRDTDSDNDGIPDAIAAGKVTSLAQLESAVVDEYGVPVIPDAAVEPDANVVEPDSDGDGLTDEQEEILGTGVGLADSDGDGYSDADEVLVHRTDPLNNLSTPLSTDPNSATTDSDGDGIADTIETMTDSDADSLPNQFDLDSDNDGLADVLEAGLPDTDFNGLIDPSGLLLINPTSLIDTDSDGTPDYLDLDSDADTKSDHTEAGFTDVDDNGAVDLLSDENNNGWHDPAESYRTPFPDVDADGVPDYLDADDQLVLGAALQNDAPYPPSKLLRVG